ncbi:MAG: cell division protein FtsZ [Pseudomonadota bacterium]
MPLNLSAPNLTELKPRISVIGVGGAGGNAVNNMISASLEGVEFLVANTDAQAVGLAQAGHKVQLGTTVTQGLGAGSRPEVGRAAAEESLDEVMGLVDGANMLFITAGMGGGTGTGAAPVIAKAAREKGILTVGVVTKPFQFEGARRMRIAEEGIESLQEHVDTLLIIPNQNLFRLADENTTFQDAFGMADEVLHAGVRGITDLMIVPGLINLDFADVRAVMSEMGKAMMGTGEATGDDRATAAALAAISNPLLDETSMKGANGVLINITGGLDMKLFEVDEAANRIRSEVDPDANIIVGSTFNQDLEGVMRVSVVATGIERTEDVKPSYPVKPVADAVSAPSQVERSEVVLEPTATPSEALETETSLEAAIPTTMLIDDSDPLPVDLPTASTAKASVPSVADKGAPPSANVVAVTPLPSENPVGDVHDRIRRMLTEDDALRLRHEESVPQRANPFRRLAEGLPIDQAMSRLKETFGQRVGPHGPTAPRAPARRDAFADENPDDLEIPAFLRRSNSK